MKTVIINISEEALKDIMDIQSKDGMGYNLADRQACMMQAISELNLSLELDDTASIRFKYILDHLFDYEKLLREINNIEIIKL